MKLEIDFISSESFAEKSPKERLDFILKSVKRNRIIVIEGVLKPKEQMKLIEDTMKSIDEKFTGIEVYSLGGKTGYPELIFQKFIDSIPIERILKILESLTGKKFKFRRNSLRRGITLIGPSKIIKKIKRGKKSFSVLAEV